MRWSRERGGSTANAVKTSLVYKYLALVSFASYIPLYQQHKLEGESGVRLFERWCGAGERCSRSETRCGVVVRRLRVFKVSFGVSELGSIGVRYLLMLLLYVDDYRLFWSDNSSETSRGWCRSRVEPVRSGFRVALVCRGVVSSVVNLWLFWWLCISIILIMVGCASVVVRS